MEVRTLRASADDKHDLVRREPHGQLLPPRPASRSALGIVRRTLLPQLPDLIHAILERAKAGDMDAAKFLWKIAELERPTKPPAVKRPRKDFVQRALAEFRARH